MEEHEGCVQRLLGGVEKRKHCGNRPFRDRCTALWRWTKITKVVRNAILWNDQRTGKNAEEIIETAGGIDGLVAYTNNTMVTGFTGGKILWVRKNEPENYARIAKFVMPKGLYPLLSDRRNRDGRLGSFRHGTLRRTKA